MPELGRYIYCIIQAEEPKSFGPYGVGDGSPELFTVHYQDLAAVVSRSLVIEYPVTREHSMAHQHAIEAVMKEHAVLPVRFCTIAYTQEQIITQVLTPRYEEFKQLLAWISDKQEISVKAHWLDMKAVFQEIAQQSEELKAMKAQLAGRHPDAAYYDRIEVGRIVQQRLGEKREAEEQQLLARLASLAVDHRINRVYGETMVANLAFLVENANEETFHQTVSSLQEELAGRIKLKYVTGAPLFNFVTITIHLEKPEHQEPGKTIAGQPESLAAQGPKPEAYRDVSP